MIAVVPFEPERFRSTAAHYRARPAYPPRLIALVAELCRLGPADRLLDLGCGPGPLATMFRPYVGSILAVDPEPEMLAQAALNAARTGVQVEFRAGSSSDLGPSFGRFKAVVIGRAFHWMDRVDTLKRLDRMIEPDGAVVLLSDSHPKLPENAWLKDYSDIGKRYAGERPLWRSPDFVPHEAILLSSPFPALERVSVIERRATPAEDFVDRALSRSRTSPARLGVATAEALAGEIRALTAEHAQGGLVTEVVEAVALIARRAET
ncbi:class I SAM-dependent methyltransferase [Mesorhizobium sp. CN2-181]|uniref:class I SAM-dependent methyltransferase n=1 Tax=Mesorhizobium yinganensis TaxID=3157707 RepID=UPI0032B82170